MAGDELLAGVQEVFRGVFDEPDMVITRKSSAETVPDWDSLTHVNLVTAIEKKYKVKFALGELQELKDVGDLLDLLGKKLAKKESEMLSCRTGPLRMERACGTVGFWWREIWCCGIWCRGIWSEQDTLRDSSRWLDRPSPATNGNTTANPESHEVTAARAG